MNTFKEERFPTDIAFGSSGGPQRNTEIITLGSGREQRNQRWAHSRRRYDAGYGVKKLKSLEKVVDLFESCRGPLIGFRYRDVIDFKSCGISDQISPTDQKIGNGDGEIRQFPLTKTYGNSQDGYTRMISKPVFGTVIIAINGVELTETTHWSVDVATGLVEFDINHVPAVGDVITAGFEFDVPVRFDMDVLEVNLAAFNAGNLPSIPLVEILQ